MFLFHKIVLHINNRIVIPSYMKSPNTKYTHVIMTAEQNTTINDFWLWFSVF